MLGLDEPLARDRGVVHARREVAVGGDNFGFGPVVREELGLLAAGGRLRVGVHGAGAESAACARFSHSGASGQHPPRAASVLKHRSR